MILKYFGEKYKKLYFNLHVTTFLSKKYSTQKIMYFHKKFYDCEIILNILIAKHVHMGGGYNCPRTVYSHVLLLFILLLISFFSQFRLIKMNCLCLKYAFLTSDCLAERGISRIS